MFRHLLCIPLLLATGLASGQTPARATAARRRTPRAPKSAADITPIQPPAACRSTPRLRNCRRRAFHSHHRTAPPDFTSAGEQRWKQHGKDNPNGHHAGDRRTSTWMPRVKAHLLYRPGCDARRRALAVPCRRNGARHPRRRRQQDRSGGQCRAAHRLRRDRESQVLIAGTAAPQHP